MLFRASHHGASLEVELTRRNIPFVKFGGLKFLEAAHIKDVLSVLRWTQNARDRVAGFRAAQLLPGIGPSSAARLLDRMADAADPLRALSEFRPPAAAAQDWPEFEATIGILRRNAAGWPAEGATGEPADSGPWMACPPWQSVQVAASPSPLSKARACTLVL